MAQDIKKVNGVYMGSQELASTRFAGDVNLKAYYKFSTGALTTDSSGAGHTLTAISDPAEGTGKFGGGVDLDGNDAYSITDHADLKPTGNFSIVSWFKRAGTSDEKIFTSFSYPSSRYAGLIFDIQTNKLFLTSGKNSGTTENTDWAAARSITTITDTNWHLAVGTWDGSLLKVYLDGNFEGQISWANAPVYSSTNIRIGCQNNTGTEIGFFTGSLDDLFLLNGTALTSDEIYSLYKTGVKKLNGQSNLNPELESSSLRGDANLRAYWKLEDVNDETANNYDLTNVNTVAFNAGKMGNCADTGATNSTKKLTVASNLGIAGGNCSINLWFNSYATTFAGDHPPLISILSDLTGGTGVVYGLGINGTGLFAFRLKSGIAWQETSATAISASTWYMATMTYDGTNCKLYINGSYTSQVAASGNGSAGYYADQTALFCHAGYTADAFTSAKIDDCSVFNDTLTATEISNLYNTNIKKYLGVSNV